MSGSVVLKCMARFVKCMEPVKCMAARFSREAEGMARRAVTGIRKGTRDWTKGRAIGTFPRFFQSRGGDDGGGPTEKGPRD